MKGLRVHDEFSNDSQARKWMQTVTFETSYHVMARALELDWSVHSHVWGISHTGEGIAYLALPTPLTKTIPSEQSWTV